jgi:hypothetical protein
LPHLIFAFGGERQPEGAVDVDLGFLLGRTLSQVERLGSYAWRFRFGPDAEVRAESPWRIIRDGGIVLGSEDHGHQYGLPSPIDAQAECQALIGGTEVRSAEVRAVSRDLVVGFGPGVRLELVPLSSGYESWQVAGPRRLHIVAMGGGELAVWGPDAEPRS